MGHRGPTQRSVTIEGNTVWNYNKNGIDVRGNVNATILGNTVTGSGPVDYIAQNGIVVLGADTVAQVGGNKVSGNYYTGPADTYATGILVIDGKVSIDRKNTVSGNEVDIDNRHHRRQVQRLTTRAAGSQHQPLTVRQDN